MRLWHLVGTSLLASLLLGGCPKSRPAAGVDAGFDAGAAPAAVPGKVAARQAILGEWAVALDPSTQRTSDLARLAVDPSRDAGPLTKDEGDFVAVLRDGGMVEPHVLIEDVESTEVVLTADTLTIRGAGSEDTVRYEVLEAGASKVRIRIFPEGIAPEQIVFTLLGPDRMAMGDTPSDPAAVQLRRRR